MATFDSPHMAGVSTRVERPLRERRRVTITIPHPQHGCTALIALGGNAYPGKFAAIDSDDLAVVAAYAWRPKRDRSRFYAIATPPTSGSARKGTRRATTIRMHRLIIGDIPDGYEIDHVNRNGLDNRRLNLRLATRTQNNANHQGQPNATSRFRGVHLIKTTGRWRAGIRCHGVVHHLGVFGSQEDAARAYDAAAVELFGAHAYLNFPREKVS